MNFIYSMSLVYNPAPWIKRQVIFIHLLETWKTKMVLRPLQAILPRRSHLGVLNYSFSKASSFPNHQRSWQVYLVISVEASTPPERLEFLRSFSEQNMNPIPVINTAFYSRGWNERESILHTHEGSITQISTWSSMFSNRCTSFFQSWIIYNIYEGIVPPNLYVLNPW